MVGTILITALAVEAVSLAVSGVGLSPESPPMDISQQWGKDPFLHPPEPSSEPDAPGSPVELQGVITGPTGVVAILNHQIVRVGDRVDGELVLEITPHAVVLQRGQHIRRVAIRAFAIP
jgi:hypothetical protein